MKMKFAISSFCVVLWSATIAQGGFAPVGAQWTYAYADHIPFSYHYRPYTTTITHLELFEGRECAYMQMPEPQPWGGDHTFWIGGNGIYLYEENDSVYFWSPYSQQFELLYDFTAEVGDSWVIGGLSVTDPGEYMDFLNVTIDSIGSVIVGNDTLKVWYHQESPYFDWGNAIIERIGSNSFMIPSFGLYESRLGNVRCYDDITSDYKFVSYPCDTVIFNPIWSATENNSKESKIVLSPNPVHDLLHISSTEYVADGMLRIIDLQGRVVHKENMTIPGICDVTHLAPGVYFCNVMLGTHSDFIQRIVKLH